MKWLEEYSGESTTQLLGLADSHDRGSLLGAFHEGLSQKSYRLKGQICKEELYLLAVTEFDQEVKNGGYGQFLRNSSSRYTPYVADALTAIGASKKSALTRKVLSSLPEGLENLSLSELSRYFQSADEEYFSLDRACEEHGELLWNFIQANEESIVLP